MGDLGQKFKKGDFITYNTKKGSFVIYEGCDVSTNSNMKKLTIGAWFDPEKWTNDPIENRWRYMPFFEHSTKNKNCEKSIDTDIQTYWWRYCTEEEKENAIKKLEEYGLSWNEETLSLVSLETGETVYTLCEPNISYDGKVINLISKKRFSSLVNFCVTKNKSAYDYSRGGYYPHNYNPYDFWDE